MTDIYTHQLESDIAKVTSRVIRLEEMNAWLEHEKQELEDENHDLQELVAVMKGQIQQMNLDRDHPDNPVEA